MGRKYSNMKKQDIPVVAGIIFEAYIRNKADFVDFSSYFGGTFEADMGDAVKAVIDRRRPADVSDKKKMVTIEVYNKLDELQEQLRLLGEYVKLAEDDLLTPYSGYHIKRARKELQKKNVEGVIEHCEVIVDKIVNDDAVALAAMDFDAGKLAAFEAKVLELRELNREQVHKVNERQDVKATEEELFVALFDFVSKVSSVGKAMYTYKHKQKFSDFSVSKILGQINHGRKKKVADDGGETDVAPVYDVMIGTVTDKTTDGGLEDAVVRIEGANIMADTDEDGEFYIEDIPAGVYTISFKKRGYVGAEQHNVEVGTERMVELNVELLPEEMEV
jgi:Carboxypeptidase regulatory-like domain